MTEEPYDIRKHLSVLTRSKESKTKWHCPACQKNDLDIDPKTGKYRCFSGGCNSKDIRQAIDRLEGKPDWKPQHDDWVKPIRPKSQQEFFYSNRDGTPLVKVVRIDYGDGQKKKFFQHHWNGVKWVSDNPDDVKKLIPIYRYAEVREAIERGDLIFVVEGESTVEALRELGIAATTTIGGSQGYGSYGNYEDDLKGARLVLCPDRSIDGIKYISNFERDCPDRIEGCYLAGTSELWRHHPAGGMDIRDDIDDYGYTKEQIIGRVISPEKYRSLLSQPESKDPDLAEDLKCSLELKNGKAPNVFGGELGKLLAIAASNFNLPVEIMTFCLLPILASQIDSKTELLINPGTDYRVPAVRWCGLVGDTGSKKSPVLGLLTKALSSHQNELYNEYKGKKLAYDVEYRGWKATNLKDRGAEPELPAPLRDLYFEDFTIEGIILSLSHYPDGGYLLMLDELAAFFSAMDAYRGGKGSDRQKWLTIWNGGGIKVNRKSSETICVPQSSISIIGGIQPQTIANLIGGDNNQQDGLYNRFSLMLLPHNATAAFTDSEGDLRAELDKIYRALSKQETQTHSLSLAAKPSWKSWHDEIEARTISEFNWLIKGTCAKFEGIAARNALIMHRTLAAIDDCEPEQLISSEVLKLAIAWTKFELNQTLSQYQVLAIDGTDRELARIIKFIDKFEGKGFVNARTVARWWTTKPFPSVDEARAFMAKIVKLEYAKPNDESIESSKYQIQVIKNSSDSTDKKPESFTSSEVNPVGSSTDIGTDNTDNSSDNLENTLLHDDGFTSVSTVVGTDSNDSKALINGDLVHNPDRNVGTSTDSFKPIQDKVSSHFVSIVSTVDSNKNLKVDDLVKPSDLFHERGQDVGIVKAIEGELYSVVWNSDRVVRRYTNDELAVVAK
ncbi:DUF3987 domain-containing protein [Chamaesiphon sp.]|uniref:DUF3987 domain-containing protein n=1 Tax=Chamaesiphon sp. TaxID=2814140 RepID=UPI003593403D